MLITKSNKVCNVGDIVAIKLAKNSQEVIGKMVAFSSETDTDGYVVLSRPCTAQLERAQDGSFGFSFPPFMMAADDDAEIRIKLDKILVGPVLAREDMRAHYAQMMSPLVLPPQSTLKL